MSFHRYIFFRVEEAPISLVSIFSLFERCGFKFDGANAKCEIQEGLLIETEIEEFIPNITEPIASNFPNVLGQWVDGADEVDFTFGVMPLPAARVVVLYLTDRELRVIQKYFSSRGSSFLDFLVEISNLLGTQGFLGISGLASNMHILLGDRDHELDDEDVGDIGAAAGKCIEGLTVAARKCFVGARVRDVDVLVKWPFLE